jgi:hypothetical protein
MSTNPWKDIEGPVGFYDKKGRPISLREYHRLKYEQPGYYRIGDNQVGETRVLTVWLGLDHRFNPMDGDGPPILFETKVFGGPDDQKPERYTSEVAALAGHDRWVDRQRYAVKRRLTADANPDTRVGSGKPE